MGCTCVVAEDTMKMFCTHKCGCQQGENWLWLSTPSRQTTPTPKYRRCAEEPLVVWSSSTLLSSGACRSTPGKVCTPTCVKRKGRSFKAKLGNISTPSNGQKWAPTNTPRMHLSQKRLMSVVAFLLLKLCLQVRNVMSCCEPSFFSYTPSSKVSWRSYNR